MGVMIEGQWTTDDDYELKDGEFVRPSSELRDRVGGERYAAEANRYRLYVHPGCPWANRTWMAWHHWP